MSFVLIVKNPCCSSSKSRLIHNHLKHIPSIRKFWPRRNNYLNPTKPISIIIARLEKEDRCLDQINGGEGSLANAMAKELFGDENQFSAGYILFTRIFISKKASFFFLHLSDHLLFSENLSIRLRLFKLLRRVLQFNTIWYDEKLFNFFLFYSNLKQLKGTVFSNLHTHNQHHKWRFCLSSMETCDSKMQLSITKCSDSIDKSPEKLILAATRVESWNHLPILLNIL